MRCFELKTIASGYNMTPLFIILLPPEKRSSCLNQNIQSNNRLSVIMNLDFGQKQQFEVKNILMDLFLTNTALGFIVN